MKNMVAVAKLAALAQESRLAIFRLVVEAGRGGLPAGIIAEKLRLPAPTLSFHLARMKQAGLIDCRRQGRSLIYAADFPAINALVAYLTENCCGAGRCVAPALMVSTQESAHATAARARRSSRA
jgi:DNA-binding transcriptional ArsR family regulator